MVNTKTFAAGVQKWWELKQFDHSFVLVMRGRSAKNVMSVTWNVTTVYRLVLKEGVLEKKQGREEVERVKNEGNDERTFHEESAH